MKITVTDSKPLHNQLCGKIHLMTDKMPLCGAKLKEMYRYEFRGHLTTEEMVDKFVNCKNCKRIFKCLSITA